MSKIKFNVKGGGKAPTIYSTFNYSTNKKEIKLNTKDGVFSLKGIVFYGNNKEYFVNAFQLMQEVTSVEFSTSIEVENGNGNEVYYTKEDVIDFKKGANVVLYAPLSYLELPIKRTMSYGDDLGETLFYKIVRHETEYFTLFTEITDVQFYELDWKDYLISKINEIDFTNPDSFSKVKEIFNYMSNTRIDMSKTKKIKLKGSGINGRSKNNT